MSAFIAFLVGVVVGGLTGTVFGILFGRKNAKKVEAVVGAGKEVVK